MHYVYTILLYVIFHVPINPAYTHAKRINEDQIAMNTIVPVRLPIRPYRLMGRFRGQP